MPGTGVLAFGAAAVVGLLTVIPAVGAALAPGEDRIHPLLGITGLVGSALCLLGVFQPALEGEPFLSDDLWTDASLVMLIAALAGAGVLVATARTGEAWPGPARAGRRHEPAGARPQPGRARRGRGDRRRSREVGLVDDDGPSWEGSSLDGSSLDGTDLGSFDDPQFVLTEEDLDELTGDGCPPPDYDCVDD